jgi:hypothetical protein
VVYLLNLVLYQEGAASWWNVLSVFYKHTDKPREMCRGVDKFLARPRRKKATATKLGILSTYSQRSSIHFLARCSNFYKPLKKIIRFYVQPGYRGSNGLHVGRKIAKFQLFFQSRGQVVIRRGQIRRIGWVGMEPWCNDTEGVKTKVKVKVKIKFTLEQATKAQRWGSSTALLFL